MKRFLALSRTTHAILDIAAPAFCALLWLGKFPSWSVILLSLFSAFAGYTAIYTLNDLVGIRGDREKFAGEGINPGYSVEASALRYPLARKALSPLSGWIWFSAWALLAMIGSYFLNPVIILIFLAAACLEVAYCALFKVTYWRTIVSGLVKASGPLAAVFVVNPHPPFPLVLLQFVWLIFWEIGGQNIPADWNDVAEDRRVSARTIPLQFGPKHAGWIVLISLSLTVISGLFLELISPIRLGWLYFTFSFLSGCFLLLLPAYQLCRSKENCQAGRLFDRASYYPLAHLTIMALILSIGYLTAG